MLNTNNILQNLSFDRFNSYLNLAANKESEAFKLYEFNIKLSESFYPSLHNLEISLRNNFHLSIAKTYGENWFLNRDLMAGTNKKEFVNISKIDEIIAKSKQVNSSVIISNLSFGFWVSLLYPNYELSMWRQSLRNVFTENQKITRKEIHQKLESIKQIRNRAAHHELILKFDLKLYHQTIYEILEHLSPELANWTSQLDRFPKIFSEYQDFLAEFQTIKNPGDLQVEVGPGHLG